MSESQGMISGESVMINGGKFFLHHQNSNTGIQEFRNRISIDASHNSLERSNEVNLLTVREIVKKWRPRVQEKSTSSPLSRYNRTDSSSSSSVKPDNIEEVLDDIFTWVYDPRSHSLMVWVYDDENRKETPLVSQVVADILDEHKDLSASFFFTAGSAAGRAETVIPTIAHQLAQHIPEAQALIGAAADDTSLFRLAMKEQIRKLIVNPLQAASQSSLSAGRRKFILIHGLEDCDETFQILFIGYLSDALDSIKDTQFPHRLLLLGRPTNNLRKYFFSGGSKVRHCPMSKTERMMCRREERVQGQEEDVLKKIEALGQREKELKKQEQDMQRLMEEITQQQELLQRREQENDMRHNGVRPGCTCREHMPEGCHTERCLSAQCIQYNNNLLSPATKEDISHSMDFPGFARFAVAQEAMQHLEQNSATFQKIFTDFNIPEFEYQLLAGFDEDIIRSRLGYLNQIHVILRSEPQDMNRFLLCLHPALKNFTAIIFTNKSTYRLPSSPEEFHEIVRANTCKTSYGISTLSQHVDAGGSFNVGPNGGNNGGDRPGDSTRKGKEQERDSEDPSIPHNSSKEDGEPGPESPGPGSSDARSAELAFRVSANLLQNGIAFQSLHARGTLKIKRTPESQDPSQFATCNIEFTGLRTANMVLSEENPVYHHFQLDIRFDALSKFTDTPDVRPLSTPQYNPEAKFSKGVKKAWNALASGSLSLLPPKATIGTSGGRTGEESTNTEKTVNISRIMYRESNGIILWKFHLVDRFEQESGLALSPEKLPLAHISFGGDEAAPPSPPAHLNVEIFTYWSILSSPRGNAWTGSKPRFSNLCKIITLNLSKDLQGSHLYLSNLLVQVDANPIITTAESEVQGYLGRAIVAETKHTANTPI